MTLSAGQSSTVCCQAKLADKDGVLDAVQGLGQAICFHSRRTHKLQQDLSLLYLLVDPLVADIDVPRARGLQGLSTASRAFWLSVWTSNGAPCGYPASAQICTIHFMLRVVGVKLMNSASMVEIVTIVCFWLFQMIGQPAKKTIWPPIETLVSKSFANDASPYIY